VVTTSKAIFLAAGVGSRLRPYTDDRPKPMVQVGGMPLLEHSLRRLAKHGILEFGVNLHYQPQVVRSHFGDGSRHGVSITYSMEPELLGTAGAVKALESFIDGQRVLVHYGDNLSTCDLEALEAMHVTNGATATLALFEKEDVSPHSAVDLDENGRITRFIEKPKPGQTTSRWISAGVLLLEPTALRYIDRGQRADFGFDLFPRLLAAGEPLFGYRMGPTEGLWWIDTPGDYARVSDLAERGLFA
jgi:NDP-sugar pyrophosphorylase family protein